MEYLKIKIKNRLMNNYSITEINNNDIRDIMFMICNKFKFNLENITNNDVDYMIDIYYNNRNYNICNSYMPNTCICNFK